MSLTQASVLLFYTIIIGRGRVEAVCNKKKKEKELKP
jgi:hypothetical protein